MKMHWCSAIDPPNQPSVCQYFSAMLPCPFSWKCKWVILGAYLMLVDHLTSFSDQAVRNRALEKWRCKPCGAGQSLWSLICCPAKLQRRVKAKDAYFIIICKKTTQTVWSSAGELCIYWNLIRLRGYVGFKSLYFPLWCNGFLFWKRSIWNYL